MPIKFKESCKLRRKLQKYRGLTSQEVVEEENIGLASRLHCCFWVVYVLPWKCHL